MKLSKNFWLSEFTSRPAPALTGFEMYMLQCLCKNILEPLREFLGNGKIHVSSGMRSPADYHRLISEGYFPSRRSDHFFGNEIYPYSVGAADIVPEGDAAAVFETLMAVANPALSLLALPSGDVAVGQVIFELGNKSQWIHISNPKTTVYDSAFAKRFFRKTSFLRSDDNGRSYQSIFT